MAASLPVAACGAAAADGGASVTRVLLFDVDGTLVRSDKDANVVHKGAFTHAIAAVMGPGFEGVSIEEIEHQGMTDMWIVDVLLAKRGVPAEVIAARMPAIVAAMVEYCEQRRAQVGVTLLPGVPELLKLLSARPDVVLGLVTGNLEPIAHLKLAASGLGGYFCFGGFGSDMYDRGELVKTALARAQALYPRLDLPRCLAYHTGDTLYDLRAATHAGVRGVGVCTGNFPRAVLAGVEGGYHALEDSMADTARWVALFELDGR